MLGQTFYHQTIRKYVVLFGTLFNDLNIEKKDSSGNVTSRQKVPIAYGPKQKFLQRIRQDPSLTKQVAIQLPRMGFEMTSITYDPIRKLNSVGKILNRATATQGLGTLQKMFNPVPYNMDFQLFVFVDNAEDGTQILEQILPFFTPEFNVTINAIPSMGVKLDVPISFNSASLEDSYDGDLTTRRTMIWTLDFFMKGFLYPDIKGGGKIVKSVVVDFHEFDGLDNKVPDLDKLRLESSTIMSSDHLTLEDDRFFVLETGGAQGDVISRITITPEGGKDAVVDSSGEFDANTTITIFNPAINNDPETGDDT
tara:strand:+ start:10655 stop:11584 length:930 start_codon:yes stop_codon:yes gene_type:complete